MTLVGQILWAAPFAVVSGNSSWAPGVADGCAAAIGLGAAYVLARSVLSRRWAGACVALTLSLPGFLLNTTGFMTDVPAFAADMACLAVGAAALRRRGGTRWALLALSMVVGCFGFAIREFDIAAPAAVLLAMLAQDRRRWRLYVVTGVAVLVTCGAVYLWTSHLPGMQHETLGRPDASSLKGVARFYFTLSFGLSPLLLVAARKVWRLLSLPELLLGAAVAAAGAWLLARGEDVFVGNYLTEQGATGDAVLSGGRPELFLEPLWQSFEVVAVVAGAVLAPVAAAGGRWAVRYVLRGTAPGMLAAFAVLSGVVVAAFGLLRGDLFDRYLWPLAFASAVLLVSDVPVPPSRLHAMTRRHRAARRVERAWPVALPSAALAALAIMAAAAVTFNADAYDGARWRAGQLAVAAGRAATTVDAGFEWVGSHATQLAKSGRHVAGDPVYETWYDEMFTGFRDCAFVSNSPWHERSLRLFAETTYDELGFAVPEHLYTYLVANGCSR
jgi:hypothetical protein